MFSKFLFLFGFFIYLFIFSANSIYAQEEPSCEYTRNSIWDLVVAEGHECPDGYIETSNGVSNMYTVPPCTCVAENPGETCTGENKTPTVSKPCCEGLSPFTYNGGIRCVKENLDPYSADLSNNSEPNDSKPNKVPTLFCSNVSNNEFHSLRPYPANISCTSNITDYASYCGGDLSLTDSIEVEYPGTDASCSRIGDKVNCKYNIHISKKVTIDLSNAELPIMGNTEAVVNKKKNTDDFDDAQKMNEYVSWYLGGVTNKKEYPDKNDSVSIVNYSGPLAKLIPQEIQFLERYNQVIKEAGVTRHDQVVVCTKGIDGNTPTECNGLNGMRLSDWNGDLSAIRGVGNVVVSLLNVFVKSIPWIGQGVVANAVNDNKAWNLRTPPLMSGLDPNGEPFNNLTYQKAYNEWRGKSCIMIPFPKFLVCLESYLVPNRFADLYSYIPLSSTEDIKGEIVVDNKPKSVGSSAGTTKLTNVSFTNIFGTGKASSTLFFPHMQESDELGSILQKTYIPKDVDGLGNPTNISSETSCIDVEVRSNAGDNLFASQIIGTLTYDVSFEHKFDYLYCSAGKNSECKNNKGQKCQESKDGGVCVSESEPTTPKQYYTKSVSIKLSTSSNTPKADDIWSRLVAGPMSVFKRIFPKTNTEGSVGKIMDIAGSTSITYSGTNVSGSSATTDLKIPHIGGVYEYFLKGIQTALRPKGYGDNIIFDNNASDIFGDSSSICDSSCNPNPTNVDMAGVKESFIADGIRWGYGTEGSPRIDMYDTVVSTAKAAGVDPIFVLALWIHESGGSNYSAICSVQGKNNPNSEYCQWVQDFGINDSSIATKIDSNGNVIEDHFMDQLNAVVNLPGYYYDLCNNDTSAKCPIEYFYAMYRLGQCKPTNVSSGEYGGSMKRIYNILTAQDFPCYPIKIPDN